MKRFSVNMPPLCIALVILLCSFFVSTNSIGQTKFQSAGGVKITIEGTSNLHDWKMESDKGTSTGVFDINNAGMLTGMSALTFSVPAESLKSDSKGLDKNSYKALNSSKYAAINFAATSANIQPASHSGYVLTVKGKLTISGVTKDVILTANGTVNADKSITWSGSYQLKMTDYNVEPPSLMFGAIKTGNSIVVKYNLVLKAV